MFDVISFSYPYSIIVSARLFDTLITYKELSENSLYVACIIYSTVRDRFFCVKIWQSG